MPQHYWPGRSKIGFALRLKSMTTPLHSLAAPLEPLDDNVPPHDTSLTEERLRAITTHHPDSLARLGAAFITRQPAQALPAPYLVGVSTDALQSLGFPDDASSDPAFVAWFSGLAQGTRLGQASDNDDTAASLPHADLPYASVYSGHQFGNWAGQLGDGRALGIGELTAIDGHRQELQFKGSGPTPYSRMGDGRAVLRSSIREFLCSEAMDALGIPTTRALCIIGSDLPIRRETLETAAIVTRFAPSFIRFGHFEHFWSIGQFDALRTLADHVISRFYPALRDADNPYAALLSEVTLRTADLLAQWQAAGFCHGVMNTDNMSILGLTIDYGPFGFLDGFDAKHICNHTDQGGRYAYENQPQVAYWNLFCLAQALLPLIAAPNAHDPQPEQDSTLAEESVALAKASLAPYKARYGKQFVARMRAKLGLASEQPNDTALIDRLLHLMSDSRADFTLTFRRMAGISARGAAYDLYSEAAEERPDASHRPVRDLFLDRAAFDAWALDYRARLNVENSDDDTRRQAMFSVNPKYVLRNHLAEVAIRAARERDFSETQKLVEILRKPFDEQPHNAAYAALPPDWATSLEVSCSS